MHEVQDNRLFYVAGFGSTPSSASIKLLPQVWFHTRDEFVGEHLESETENVVDEQDAGRY